MSEGGAAGVWGRRFPTRSGGGRGDHPGEARANSACRGGPGAALRGGAALACRPGETVASHRPGRKAGALVVLVNGSLVLYVERGGRTLLSWSDDPEPLAASANGLAAAVREGALGRLTVERADGGRGRRLAADAGA